MTVVPYAPTMNAGQPLDAVDGWVAVIEPVIRLAQEIAGTDFVPAGLRGKTAAVTAAILAGRELGLAPMTSLQHVHMIDGRPSLSAQMQRALVQAHGHRIVVPHLDAHRCDLVGYRHGESDAYPVSFSMDDARRAGLDRRPNYSKWPRQMLLARATGELCRMAFADVIGGMAYTSEELADLTGAPDPGIYGSDAEPVGAVATTTVKRASRAKPARPAAPVSQPPLEDRGAPGDTPPLDDEPSNPPVSDHRPEPIAHAPQASQPPMPAPPLDDVPEPQLEPQAPAGAPAEPGPEQVPTAPRDDAQSAGQRAQTMVLLRGLGVATHDDRQRVVSALVGRPVAAFQTLGRAEVSTLIDTLTRVGRHPKPAEYLEVLVTNGGLDLPERVATGMPPWSPDNPQPDRQPEPESVAPVQRHGSVRHLDDDADLVTESDLVPEGQLRARLGIDDEG